MTRPLILAALLGALVSPALAEEQRIEIASDGGAIVGTLNDADGASDKPVVLLLHGFTGTRDELPVEGTNEGVFSRTARVLAEAGYPSLRIDFRGSGESMDISWAETTFSSQIADGFAALEELETRFPDRGQVVIGWSQGGLIAAHLAGGTPDLEALVLWAPAAVPMFTFGALLGPEATLKAATGDPAEPHTMALPWGVETTLNGAFFAELLTTDPVAAAAAYPGPMIVFVGSNDDVVAPQPQMGELYIRYHQAEDELVVKEMDHVFNAFTGPGTLDEMLGETVEWLDAR